MATIRGTFYLQDFRCQLWIIGMVCSLALATGCVETDTIEGVTLARAGRIKVNVFEPVRIENAAKVANYFGQLKANRVQTLGFSVGGKLTVFPENQQKFTAGATIATLEVETLLKQRGEVEQQIGSLSGTNGDAESARRLERQLGELELQIEQRSILAPFDCVVDRSFSSLNSFVRPNAPVVTVVESTYPKIEIRLPKNIASRIEPERNYVFILEGQRLDATMRERALSEGPPGTVLVTFDISSDLSQVDFFLEQSVEARFSFPTQRSGYWLPLSCLQLSSDGQWSVFVVRTSDQYNEVEPFPVDIFLTTDDSVFVTSELEGQFLVRDGIHRVVPGQRVEINLLPAENSVEAKAQE